ncbi:MAG: outer membrane protein assembly factor BamE [Alphaproteobacteria bacterium]|nr:outer membrane protein assembly factor BamE [Alphaproteobacteria bacterium]
MPLPALAHGLWVLIEMVLDSLENFLVLPARDALLLAGGAPMTIQGHGRRTIFLITIVTLLVLAWFISNQSGKKFEADKWKSWKETEFSLSMRWDMVGDLQRNHSLYGMSKSQVLDLLGPPDTVFGSEHSYYLGMARKGINTGQLRITFGDDQVVSEVSVWDG